MTNSTKVNSCRGCQQNHDDMKVINQQEGSGGGQVTRTLSRLRKRNAALQ